MFDKVLKDCFDKAVEKGKERLLERDLDKGSEGDYFIECDRDTVDIGVGRVTVREDIIQDEERAKAEAREDLIDDMVNGCFDEVSEFEEFKQALNKLLRGL